MADPNNYQPISLLSTAYQLLARVLQQRLEKGLEPYLRDTQYGFRSGRSTSQPIHVVRRLLERAERTESSLYVLLLDWKKAFDKVNVQALEIALCWYGVPCNIVNLISSIYTSQLFTVKAAGQTSAVLEAKSGIRQGCPLSPYLFLILHSMVLHDVDKRLLEPSANRPRSTIWLTLMTWN